MLKRIERNTPDFKADVVVKRRHTADCKTGDGKRTSEAIDCPSLERKSENQDKCPLFFTGYVNGRRIRHHSLRSREIDLAIIEANRRLDELETGILQERRHDAILAKAREQFFLDGIRTKCPGNIDVKKTPEQRIQEAISLSDTFRKQNDMLKSLMAFTTEQCQPPIYHLVDITKEVLERFEDSWKGAPNYQVLCRCQCHKARHGRPSRCKEGSTVADCDCCYECSNCRKRIKTSAKEHEQWCDGKYEYKPKTLNGKGTYQQTLIGFFDWCVVEGLLHENPAAKLTPIRIPKNRCIRGLHKRQTIHRILALIPVVFKLDATRKKVRAFFLVLVSTALRIGDVVALETGVVRGDKMFNRDYSFTDIARMEEQPDAMITEMEKGNRPLYTRLPNIALQALQEMNPTSEKYFFWTGNGKLDTAKADWSEKMLELYRAAGIDERSHAFRDTLVTRALGSGKARMETASALIGHTNVQITQKKYEHWDLERQQLLDVGLEAAWEAMGLIQAPIPIDSKRTPDPKAQLKALLGQVLLEDGIGALMGLIAEITQQSESTRRSSNIA